MRHGSTPAALVAAALLGGLACVACLAPTRVMAAPPEAPQAPPSIPDERLGVRTAPLLLLSRADVRADVGLDERQTAEALRVIGELHSRAAALRGRPNAEVMEARKAVDDAQRTWIATSLTTAQRDRLVQVDLQWEGPSAVVSRASVADTLALTAEQRIAIKKVLATRGDEKAIALGVLGVLSPVQRERWKAMLGRPFTPQLTARPKDAPR